MLIICNRRKGGGRNTGPEDAEQFSEERVLKVQWLDVDLDCRSTKGYVICRGEASRKGRPQERYFFKFVKMDGEVPERMKLAEKIFRSESAFQVRHPYIVYVESGMESELVLEDGDADALRIRTDEMKHLEQGSGEITCILEEMVEGEDLEQVYACRRGKEPVPEDTMFRHMYQLICGMCAYMGKNRKDRLIHRDIKPANIRITADGQRVKYIDFDWSHVTGSTKTRSMAKDIGGTPGYSDPRQFTLTVKTSDPAMDIYALGMVFLYMMLGEDYIFGVRSAEDRDWLEDETLLYVLKKEYLLRGGIPVYQEAEYAKFRKILKKMIAKPEKRYQEPEELLKDMEHFLMQYYGQKRYQEICSDDVLLREHAVPEEKVRISLFREKRGRGKQRSIIVLTDNQVQSLRDLDNRQIGLVYMVKGVVYYAVLSENAVFDRDSGFLEKDRNILTGNECRFTIKDEKFILKRIQKKQTEE